MKRIWVLKGGGVRGVIQLEPLRIIEKHFGKPIYEIFDLIVGTSVGAINGGILAMGGSDMVAYSEIFIKYIRLIFKSHWWYGVFGPLYKRTNFFKMWDALFPGTDLRLRDCKTKFMCTAVNLVDSRTHYFKSWEAKDGEESLRDTLAKSFSAPIYFGHFVDEKNEAVWVDGGMGQSNTPIDLAYAETINLGWYKEECDFFVIGTGTVDHSLPFKKARQFGRIQELKTFLNISEGGLARLESTLNQVSRMEIVASANPLINFHYFDIDIGPDFDGIDKIYYIQEYLGFGRLVAEKVVKFFADRDKINIGF